MLTGPESVPEGSIVNIAATSGDGEDVTALADWSSDCGVAVDAGEFSAPEVADDMPCRVTASYAGDSGTIDFVIEDTRIDPCLCGAGCSCTPRAGRRAYYPWIAWNAIRRSGMSLARSEETKKCACAVFRSRLLLRPGGLSARKAS